MIDIGDLTQEQAVNHLTKGNMFQAMGYMHGNFTDVDGTLYEVGVRCPLEGEPTLSDIACLNPVTHHTAILRVPGQATEHGSGHGDVFDLRMIPLRLRRPRSLRALGATEQC